MFPIFQFKRMAKVDNVEREFVLAQYYWANLTHYYWANLARYVAKTAALFAQSVLLSTVFLSPINAVLI